MTTPLHHRISQPAVKALGLLFALAATTIGPQTLAAQTYTGHAIGSGVMSTCSVSGTTASVTGSGSNLGDKASTDNFGLCSTTESSNFTLTARVTSLSSGATAGLELRDGTANNARHELIYVTPDGTLTSTGTDRREFSGTDNIDTWRPLTLYPGNQTRYPGETTKFWIRITRYNDEISLDYSPDATKDPQGNSVTNEAYEWRADTSNQSLTGLTSSIQVGFFITGPSGSSASFDNVTLSTITSPPTQPATTWLANTFPGGGAFMQHRGQAIAADNNGFIYIQGQGEAQSLISLAAPTGKFQTYFSHSHYTGAPGIAYSCGLVWSPLYDQVGTGASLQPGLQYYNTSGQVSSVFPYDEFDAGITSGGANPITQPSVNFISVAADPSAGVCKLYALEYVAGPPIVSTKVHIFNTSTAQIADSGTPTGPTEDTPITLATSGGANVVYMTLDNTHNYIWAIEDSGTSHHVEKFSVADGSNQGVTITGLKDPRGIAVDTTGKVYVTDHDPSDQRVRVFNSDGSFAYTLGLTGGSYSESTPGTIAATSFDHPEGIAIDSSNNLYVSSSGPDSQNGFGNTGQALRMYTPNTQGGTVTAISSANLAWHTEGLTYQDGVSADLNSITDVYDKTHHFTLDYSHLADGNNAAFWTYKGTTVDDLDYPLDPRVGLSAQPISDPYDAGTTIRTVNGHKIMVVADQAGTGINIYRFLATASAPSELAAPYARLNRRTPNTNNFELWQDAGTLDGQPDSNEGCATSGHNTTEETCIATSPLIDVYQDNYYWYMDTAGNIWSVGGGSGSILIYEFLVQGTGTTLPSWCYATGVSNSCVKTWAIPTAFAHAAEDYPTVFPLRLLYDKPNDAMFITGFTNNSNTQKYDPSNTLETKLEVKGSSEVGSGTIGTQILRYDAWSTHAGTSSQQGQTGSLTANCTITVTAPPNEPPAASSTLGNGPRTFDMAHGLIVTENDFTNHVTYYYAYDSNCAAGTVKPQYQDGTTNAETLNYGDIPGPEVGATSGTIDSGQTVNVTYINDGKTYVVTSEDSGQHKVIVISRTDSNVPQP